MEAVRLPGGEKVVLGLAAMDFRNKFIVKPDRKVKLKDCDPDGTPGFRKGHQSEKATEKGVERLRELQYRLYAESKRAVLVVLQAMDAGGKDGTIRHVMSGFNPQACRVTSFKVPTHEEAAHDFLWRIHKAAPANGEVGIFNRSHYEDVLVVRVHELAPKEVWSKRYDEINQFEEYLTQNGVTIVKFFLHISKDEQRKRILERMDQPQKSWKLSPADFEERKRWADYQEAYEAALMKCSTKAAPWFIIPANKKWFRNLAVASILVETLEAMNLKFPKPDADLSKFKLK